MKVTLEFYWFYFYFLQVSVHYVLGLNSHRSRVIANGKPILRNSVDDDDNTTTIQNENTLPSAIEKENTTKPEWLKNLITRISELVNEHGYKDARPHIQRLVEDIEKQMSVLLHVEVAHDGTASIEMGPYFRARKPKKHSITRDGDELENAPKWVQEFKAFMKALVQSYGWAKTRQMMNNLIEAIEKQNKVAILDVDVDQYGEVLLHYSNKTVHYSLDSKEKKIEKERREKRKKT